MSANRSEFIRNHPKLSVADLIAEAAKQGLDIKKNLIYNTRSKDRKETDEGAPVGKKKVSKKAKVAAAKVKAAPSKKKVSKKAKVAAAKVKAAPVQDPVVVSRGLVSRKSSGSKMTLTVTLDVHDPSSLKNSRGLISSLFSG